MAGKEWSEPKRPGFVKTSVFGGLQGETKITPKF